MNVSVRHGFRTAVLGVSLILAIAVGIPYLVTAQDATPSASPQTDPIVARGEEIFSTVCIACHQPDGKGIAGIYLPLAGNPLVTLEDPTYIITVVLNGRGGMPRFDSTYADEDIASILTYIRQTWENQAGPVTVEQVAAVRATYANSAVTTPEGQIPTGSGLATPESDATPNATPST